MSGLPPLPGRQISRATWKVPSPLPSRTGWEEVGAAQEEEDEPELLKCPVEVRLAQGPPSRSHETELRNARPDTGGRGTLRTTQATPRPPRPAPHPITLQNQPVLSTSRDAGLGLRALASQLQPRSGSIGAGSLPLAFPVQSLESVPGVRRSVILNLSHSPKLKTPNSKRLLGTSSYQISAPFNPGS